MYMIDYSTLHAPRCRRAEERRRFRRKLEAPACEVCGDYSLHSRLVNYYYYYYYYSYYYHYYCIYIYIYIYMYAPPQPPSSPPRRSRSCAAPWWPAFRSNQRDPNPKDNSLIGKETSTYKGFHATFAALFAYK